ncbi:MAG: tetratricopeptide repeat protein [Candidatus Aminicenantes bacterium]|nr:tetratricopeptide repeat protein [Candidatus Aminicenantes bacterium]
MVFGKIAVLPRRLTLLLVLVILVVNLLLYSGTLGFDFLKDDHVLVENNPRVKSGKAFLDTVGERFFAFPDFSFLHYWRPLTLLSYRVDYLMWGENPWGFHVTNVLINAAVALLVFLFFLAWSGRAIPAFLVAGWFSLFPLHAENVAWISGRPDLLAALFVLAAALAFLWFLDSGRKSFLFFTFLWFVPGLLVKENLVVFPVIALVLTWMRGRWRRGRLPLVGLALVSVAFALLHAAISGSGGMLARASFSQVPVVFQTIGVYARMILVPIFPDPYFTMARFESSPLEWTAWAVAALLILAVVMWKKNRWTLSSGALGFLALMLPVLNPVLVPSYPPVAIRFVYLSAVFGGALLVDSGLRLGRKWKPALLVAITLLGVALSWVNIVYQKYFQDDETFYARMILNHPADGSLYLPLALKRANEKRYEEALFLVRRGISVAESRHWMDIREMAALLEANLLMVTGDPEAGFGRAQQIERESTREGMRFKALLIMAKYHEMRQEFSRSLFDLDRAEMLGTTAELFLQRCLVLAKMGRWPEAEAAMDKARRLNPDLTDFAGLSRLLRGRGKTDSGKGSPQPAPLRRGE